MPSPSLVNTIIAQWPKVLAAAALVGFGAATRETVKNVKEIPALLRQHDLNQTELRLELNGGVLTEMKRQTALQRQGLCLQVAQLRHGDWTKCLVSETSP